MAVSRGRFELCRAFLDDCYEIHGEGPDLPSWKNVVRQYSDPNAQATYSVMYFAKSVASWWKIRDLVERTGVRNVDNLDNLVSLGSGPQFCIMGWLFARPPNARTTVWAVDFLDWGGVTRWESHRSLMADILGDAELTVRSPYYFPDTMPRQCTSVGTRGEPLRAESIPEGSVVLLPMVMNHLLGATEHVTNIDPLRVWLRELEQRASKIILVDMQYEREGRASTHAFWSEVADLIGLEDSPPVIQFREYGERFERCYRDRLLSAGQQVPLPESERRTGRRQQFTKISACCFEADRGWRWLSS